MFLKSSLKGKIYFLNKQDFSQKEKFQFWRIYCKNLQSENKQTKSINQLTLKFQIDIGDIASERARCSGTDSGVVSDALKRFYPSRYQESISQEEKDEMESCLTEKWRGLAGKSASDCVRILLTCTRKWQFFGATLYDVKVTKELQLD